MAEKLLLVEAGYPYDLVEFDSWKELEAYQFGINAGISYECSLRQGIPIDVLEDKEWYENSHQWDFMPDFETFKQRAEEFLKERKQNG